MGPTVEGQPMGMEDNRNQVGINMSALDNTELIPENMSQIKNPSSPTKLHDPVSRNRVDSCHTKLHLQGVAPRSQYSDLALEAVTLQ